MNILKLFIIHLMLAFGLLTLKLQILNADPLDHWHFRDSGTPPTFGFVGNMRNMGLLIGGILK